METRNGKAARHTSAPHQGATIDVFCRLFHDIVPMNICHLRKKELDTFGWNTCSGCSVGLIQYWSKMKAGR